MENINIKLSKLLKIMLDGESQESNVNVLSSLNFYHNKFKNQDFKNKLKTFVIKYMDTMTIILLRIKALIHYLLRINYYSRILRTLVLK